MNIVSLVRFKDSCKCTLLRYIYVAYSIWHFNGADLALKPVYSNKVSTLITNYGVVSADRSYWNSEIFSGTEPWAPHGSIAKAWSEAEVYRALLLARAADPKAYERWEKHLKWRND